MMSNIKYNIVVILADTVLETGLSSKPNSGIQHIHLSRIIASYMYQKHSKRLAILSTLLLKTIAQV